MSETRFRRMDDLPSTTAESKALSKPTFTCPRVRYRKTDRRLE